MKAALFVILLPLMSVLIVSLLRGGRGFTDRGASTTGCERHRHDCWTSSEPSCLRTGNSRWERRWLARSMPIPWSKKRSGLWYIRETWDRSTPFGIRLTPLTMTVA